MAKADFEYDGFDDILWHNRATGGIGYWDFSDTSGSFVWKGLANSFVDSALIRIGDFGGAVNGASDATFFYLWGNNGEALGYDQRTVPSSGSSASLGTGTVTAPRSFVITEGNSDFTNDGVDDLLFRQGAEFYIRDFTAPSTFTDIVIKSLPLTYEVLFTGDFTGDNFDDVLMVDQTTGYMGFLSGSSVGNWGWTGLGYTTTEAVGDGWKVYGTGDFTNDGSEDILWFNQASRQVGFWDLANGAWTAWVGLGSAGSGWSIVTIGDYTGDNFEDIVWRNTQTGDVGLWDINNASGSYAWVGLGAPSWNWDIVPS